MDKILVIGSAGFLGSSFIRYILSQQTKRYSLVGIDKLINSSSIHNVYINKSQEFYLADFCDSHILSRIFELNNPNIVVNCITNPFKYTDADLNNLIETCKLHNVKKLIQPVSSECDTDSLSMFRMLCRNNNLDYSILKIPELFGPRQTCDNLIPKLYKPLSLDQEIYTSYNHRDMLFVEDCCSALQLLFNISEPISSVSLNSTETEFEVASYIRDYIELGEIKLIDNHYVSEEQKLSCSIKDYGWKPSRKFKDRVKFTVNWYAMNDWIFNH